MKKVILLTIFVLFYSFIDAQEKIYEIKVETLELDNAVGVYARNNSKRQNK